MQASAGEGLLFGVKLKQTARKPTFKLGLSLLGVLLP
jgi:hypothetical protein